MRPFLVLQLRPEDEAADAEFAAFLDKGGLAPGEVRRMRLDREPLPADLDLSAFAGIIVGGGPGCVSDPPATKDPVEARIEAEILGLMPQVLAQDIPYMGCCYGLGILATALGGEVSKARYGEPIGAVPCRLTPEGAADPLLAGLPGGFKALVGHKEAVQSLPSGAVHLVEAGPCPFQMIRAGRNVYATQFHPEADGPEFALRIRIYRHKGYFDPSEADDLTARVLSETVTVPAAILRGFVERYRAGVASE